MLSKHAGAAAQQSPREVVVVFGMHRSGTSLCMQALQRLGIRVDDDVLTADVNNPKGYFECRELVELNDFALGCLGTTWRTLFSLALDDDWADKPVLASAREKLTALVSRKATERSGMWGFKDPRLCALLPLYEQVFADCVVDPLYVVCIRDPRSVALSLLRRDGFPQAFSELLWMENTIRAIQVGGKRIRAVVHYENWFRQGREQLASLIAGLRLPRHDEGELSEILESTVAGSLNHAEETGPFALPCTESIYRLLQREDYAGAAGRFSEVCSVLKLATFPGRNTCRLCWSTEREGFIRTRSSIVLVEVDSNRQRVRLAVPPGIHGLAGLRLDPASQAGLARLIAIRLLSSDGHLLWEWDGLLATLEACQSHSITLLQRVGEPGVVAHFHDGNASLLLPVGGDVYDVDKGGVLEFEFAWLVTSGLTGLGFAEGLASECDARDAEVTALRKELAALGAEAEASQESLNTLRAEMDRRMDDLKCGEAWRRSVLRSWSWRLTAPLRSAGSLLRR